MELISNVFEQEGLRTTPAYSHKVVFDVVAGELFSQLAKQLSLETVRLAKNDSILQVNQEDMVKYLECLLILRKLQVIGAGLKKFNSFKYKASVPSLFASVLTQIGNSLDKEKMIHFTLYTNDGLNDLPLSFEELSNISNSLAALEKDGFKIVQGLPNDTTGELGYLAIQSIEEKLLSYRSDPFVNGFFNSIAKVVWSPKKLVSGTGEADNSVPFTTYTSDLTISYGQAYDYNLYIVSLI